MSESLLHLEAVTVHYDRRDRPALNSVNLRVAQGEFVAITGPSGSGKSSLLNVLGLLSDPADGRYFVDGASVGDLEESQRNALRAATFGFVFQSAHVMPERTVAENVALPLRLRGESSAEAGRRTRDALREVGLSGLASVIAGTLSGGERQRLAVARAVAASPRVIIADEPTGNLDSANAKAVLDILERLHARGVTVVLVTHDEQIASRASRLVKIVDGEVAADTSSSGDLPIAPSDGSAANAESRHSWRRWRAWVFALQEAAAGLFARPARTTAIVLSLVVGAGGLGAAVGLSETASQQIQQQITAAALDTLYVEPMASLDPAAIQELRDDIERINKVEATSLRVDIAASDARVQRLPPWNDETAPVASVPVQAVDSHYVADTLDLDIPQAWRFDADSPDRYVMLGAALAERLGIDASVPGAVLWILGKPHQIIAVLPSTDSAVDGSALISDAAELAASPQALNVAIIARTVQGYPAQVSDTARELVGARATISAAAELESLRFGVADDLSALVAAVAAVVLVLAGVTTASILTFSVVTRSGEIALRRALGASRGRVAATHVGEGCFLGVLGGAWGATAAICAVAAVSGARGWIPQISVDVILASVGAGLVAALLASLFPALRASAVDPAIGLRR